MDIEKHYGELTPYITLDGITVYANSMPIEMCFLGAKFKKQLKKSGVKCLNYMNVCFDKPQSFENGTVLKWKLRNDETEVYLIEEKKLFVKGKNFWSYCVGIIE